MYIVRRWNPADAPPTEERNWTFETLAQTLAFLLDPQSQASVNPAFCGRYLTVEGEGGSWSKDAFLDAFGPRLAV